jgi:uncharacterized protein (TIGR03086 family)
MPPADAVAGSAVAPLSRGLELLDAALRYALAGAVLGTPQLLSRPTPCPGWDLARLLDHLSDSLGVLRAALTGGDAAPCYHGLGPDPVARLSDQAAGLRAAYAAAGQARRQVAIGNRELSARLVAVTGTLEIAVHGWDIWVACGARRPVPPGLAALLLPIAPLLITPDSRPGLFADPVELLGPACPGDQLVAFLGRQPHQPERAENYRPARDDSWDAGWSVYMSHQTGGAGPTE